MNEFSFDIQYTDSATRARTGVIHTPHGDIETPAFVPVGTQATVKSLSPDELNALGVHLHFVNTYHMYLRPGIDVVKKMGGLHDFMHWDRPLITDSGGFQAFSLGRTDLATVGENGVTFRSHWDGSTHTFTPENSMQYQADLGADIHIAFDDCTPYPVTHEAAHASMERTHRWAVRSLAAHTQGALYGSIQGSVFEDLRKESAEYIASMDFDGMAIGGVSVGESKAQMVNVLDWVTPLLPKDKPRHLLGVGEIDDVFALIEHGVDTFDCVQPTRLARTGILLVKSGRIDITKAQYAVDGSPVDPDCTCLCCRQFSRAYLRHLFHVRELLAYRLATIHNIHFMNTLVSEIRHAIGAGTFLEFKQEWLYNGTN